jgi:hypothetical protein
MSAIEINNEYGPGLTTSPVITGETNGIATFKDIRPAQTDGKIEFTSLSKRILVMLTI